MSLCKNDDAVGWLENMDYQNDMAERVGLSDRDIRLPELLAFRPPSALREGENVRGSVGVAVKLAGYLEQRRAGFEAVVDVPPSLRVAVGRKRLRKGLGTRDVHVARSRLVRALMELHGRIDEARRGKPNLDSILTEALELRQFGADLKTGKVAPSGVMPSSFIDNDGEVVEVSAREGALDLLTDAITERAEKIEAEQGRGRAAGFFAVASGQATPMTLHVEDWLAEPGQKGAYRGRTLLDYRRIVAAFVAWAWQDGQATVEQLTRRLAGRYLATLHGQALSSARVRTIVSALSGYWRWLVQRGVVEDRPNPWTGQAPGKAKGAPKEPERAFTDEEMATLLASPPDAVMADLMRLAALSGARIEEVCRLTVAMCADGVFRVPGTKTESARREVPIHSQLAEVIKRRTEGRKGTAWLLDELGDPDRHGDRSAAVSKRFGRYREAVGVHDRDEGRRRSRVNFHSFRRWHITRALQANQPLRVVQQVVGHKLAGMTEGVYFGGDTVETKRACVEAVRLPTA